MDPRLLDYYSEELIYMRELSSEFAALHPKIARRLGLQPGDVADPYVERLLEGFCFMSARMRIKLDAEFPRFTQRLLEVIHPNYLSPTPSMAVVRFVPDLQQGDLRAGFAVPRNTRLFAKVPEGESTACEFRTSQSLQLWPIELVQARLGAVPADLPADLQTALQAKLRTLPPHLQPKGALRLRLRTMGALRFCELEGLDRLPFYIAGDAPVASHLFELLHAGACASFVWAPTQSGSSDEMGDVHAPHVVLDGALVHEGLEPGGGLLPLDWTGSHGHNLVHEYFACPERFHFFALEQMAKGIRQIKGNELEIVVLLSRPPDALAALVDVRNFSLFCSPAINLFRHRADQMEVNALQTEFHVVPNRLHPADFEVYAIESLNAKAGADGSAAAEFRPLYQSRNEDEGDHGRYFSARREPRRGQASAQGRGPRSEYVGTEVFVSLVDQHDAPYAQGLSQLSVNAWLTNRDLPAMLAAGGVNDLSPSASMPAASIGFARRPTRPRPPFAQGEAAWRLIRQLSFNHMPLADLPEREGGRALRDMLRLFVPSGNDAATREIDCLVGSRVEPVTRRLPGKGPLVYGRGILCTLTVDETGFSGSSPYLFGLVMSHYLARHVSVNVFVETRLRSVQRGEIGCWPVRAGTRAIV